MTEHRYLYCCELVGAPVAKVGASYDPVARISSFRNQSPFDMKFRKVLRFNSAKEADAAETYVLSLCTRYRERGEWVSVDAKLDNLLGEVGGIECTDKFAVVFDEGRPVAQLDRKALRKRLIASKTDASGITGVLHKYDGSEEGFDLAVIVVRLRAGYGVEDVQAMDGIPASVSRKLIAALRDGGQLHHFLNLPINSERKSIFDPLPKNSAA